MVSRGASVRNKPDYNSLHCLGVVRVQFMEHFPILNMIVHILLSPAILACLEVRGRLDVCF